MFTHIKKEKDIINTSIRGTYISLINATMSLLLAISHVDVLPRIP